TNASVHRALVAPTTADPQDETDSPDPDLLLSSAPPAEPGTPAGPQKNTTTVPSWLTSTAEEGTVAGGTDSSSSTAPRAVTAPALDPTTTGYKEAKKAGAPPAPTWDPKPGGTMTPLPWDPSRVMSKCLLAILLLALVAATFMVCTGVLGALLWRRARTAPRQLSRTEMVCLLLDGGSEADGDNLTLSSFLPEHS
ncbi:PREDICTED: P-selectin glycoprotein ligand 1, partial [Leptosomus discolor]|uniref:P-selectin glycoprotein ligand 1 n=1 Tax=Leptosomus discolor TaxID=188344 RepID=UPI0005225C2D